MIALTKEHLAQVSGGACTGGGNSRGANVRCSATVYEDKNRKVEAHGTANTRKGLTGGGVTYHIKLD